MNQQRSAKRVALRFNEPMPLRSSWDDIMYEIYVRQRIEAGLAAADAGRVVSHAEVNRRFARAQRTRS